MNLDNPGRFEEVRGTGCALRWAMAFVIAMLATGMQAARAGLDEWTNPGSIFKSADSGASWREVNSAIGRGTAHLRPGRGGIGRLALDPGIDPDFGVQSVGLA